VIVDRMDAILRSLGKIPVRIRRDVPGFVANRLQFALLREALDLVDSGVVAGEELDRLVVEGLGRRWAAVGPLATVALGGPSLFADIAAQLYPVLSQRISPPRDLLRVALSSDRTRELTSERTRVLALLSSDQAPERSRRHDNDTFCPGSRDGKFPTDESLGSCT
jgi:3-hydroxybutyryl-CoA dehydrogenase